MSFELAVRIFEAGNVPEKDLNHYLNFLKKIKNNFDDYLSLLPPHLDEFNLAQKLYFFLQKPGRYQSGSLFLSQLLNFYDRPRSHAGGNCLALTQLYNLIGLEFGLDLKVLAPENHLLSRLIFGGRKVNIEHTQENMFDLGDSLARPGRIDDLRILPSLGNEYLIAATHYNLADRLGESFEALEHCEKAIKIYPDQQAINLRDRLQRKLLGDD